MSEATTRAWAAAATALRENVLAYGGTLLDLDVFHERLAASPDDPYGVDAIVSTPAGVGLAIPLVTTSMKEWRRRGPGSPTEMLVRALGRIATVRVWRERGTRAPPFGLLETNGLGKALVERAGIDPQSFFDETWTPDIHIGDKYTDTSDWMSFGAVPPLLARAPAATRKRLASIGAMPWMSGYGNLTAVFVEAVSFDDRMALIWRPQHTTGFEIRLGPDMPQVLLTSAVGRPLKSFVSHPLLDRFPIEIVAVQQHRLTTRVQVRGGGGLWRRCRLKGGNEERAELKHEVRALRDGRRHLEKVIAGHLTLPGRSGDVEVPWDTVLEEDEIDGFVGQPWPEQRPHPFEGIMSQRSREEHLHREDDPIIRFDEDDPRSYL